jgi:aminoglycoside phosphotransferase (APT) family kinase protein
VQSLAPEAQSRLLDWLEKTAGLVKPRLGPLLAGGNANVTQLIETDTGRFVLRHPPFVAISDKAAAGITREYAALEALQGLAPVPRPVAWCADTNVTGQSFSVIEWLDGVSLTTALPEDYLPARAAHDAVSALGEEMIRGLAAVHRAPCQARLPERFGQPALFVERQIRRWLDLRAADSVRSLPLLEEVADWLLAHRPECQNPSLIHCDFHLDNCLVDKREPRLIGILDWEMATLGDPLIDLGLCLFFWQRDPDGEIGFPHVQALSNRSDIISAEALADLWAHLTGFDHRHLGYYKVFAAWRLAAIVEGAYVAHRRGLDDRDYARNLERDVPYLLREAAQHIDKGAA